MSLQTSVNTPELRWVEYWQHWFPGVDKKHEYGEMMRFDYEELQASTHKYCRFEYFFGKGSYGNLFHASVNLKNLAAPALRDGQVTLEQLDPISYRVNKLWREEVEYVGQHRHPNLLNLIGYACEEPDKALLVYEPSPEDTLQKFLFEGSALSWSSRLRIIMGVARALHFLHGLHPPLIWRVPSIATANILVDSSFNPKIFKVGFSTNCLAEISKSRVIAELLHDYVFAAPEYYETGNLTTSCNVYSFGVFLFQMISGRQPVDVSRPLNERVLVDWARQLLSEDKILKFIDPGIKNVRFIKDSVARICRVAEQCIERKATQRPSMDAVYRQLV